MGLDFFFKKRPKSHETSSNSHKQTIYPASSDKQSQGPRTFQHIETPLFPRYGHSVSTPSTPTGELYIFGGLVSDLERNDLYVISTNGGCLAAERVHTTGDIPSPRVGHASALINEATTVVVWGGDTGINNNPRQEQDGDLYLLNIRSLEWTRITAEGASPPGRYGNSIAIVGSRFFIFGGQSGSDFFNDTWVFDLSSPFDDSSEAVCSWEKIKYAQWQLPQLPERMRFGGTNCVYHFNETWSFDTTSGAWTELTCTGAIPGPREGHAAALVGDSMYIFGGRDANGRDLGDLAALNLITKHWTAYQSAPSTPPTGRSGHALAAVGTDIFLLGGESYSAKVEDPNNVYVLDTAKFAELSTSPSTSRVNKSEGVWQSRSFERATL